MSNVYIEYTIMTTTNSTNLSAAYVSIAQAASLLNVNRLTIRHWIQKRKLRGEKIGAVTLLLKKDVLNIVPRPYNRDFWRKKK
jgi:excisionase family DNA binding protein